VSLFDRRTFMKLWAAASLAPGALVAAASTSSGPARRHLLQMNGYPVDAETPLEFLTDYLTPNELFFVRSHWIPHPPDVAKWRLTVDGEVNTPLSISLNALKKLPVTEVTCVLQCAGNGRGLQNPVVPGVQWQYGAVGNARWRGVRVKDVLDRAGVKEGAKHLHTSGSDDPPGKVPPFQRSLELDKAMEDCLLAWEMNGVPLSAAHGAPVRLVVPGWAGDHWMKWLTRISPQAEAQKGFYMDTAYRYPLAPGAPGVAFKPEEMKSITELFVKSNITTYPRVVRKGSTNTIRGFAFSGAPDVARVEISDDDGSTWHEADLDTRHDPYAWRLWSWRWTPSKTATVTLLARATDSRGAIQPRETVWNQSGYLYNGWHSVMVKVTE
jgi:sulfite oxidase